MAKGKEIIMEELRSSNTLPQEMIIEILTRLPAASLVSTFKFVCKDWYTLIKHPDFIKIHLNRVAINGGRSLIRKPAIGNALYQLHPSLKCDQPPFVFEDLPICKATKLDFDFDLLPTNSNPRVFERFALSSSTLVGSCNGLLCVSVNIDGIIIILNPITRKYKISPKEPIDRVRNDVTYGFGCYNNFTTGIDEYKVVRVAYFNNRAPFQINIYSMNSNSWKRVVDEIPCKISYHRPGIFLNGAVHWIGSSRGNGNIWDTIVSFDIRDEKFGNVPMPTLADVIVANKHDMILMNMRGCLGIIYCSPNARIMDIDLEIWVMKEYGIRESWTKEFTIRTLDSHPAYLLPAGFPIDLRCIMTCFWTADQILIQRKYIIVEEHAGLLYTDWRRYGRLLMYDMNKKKINEDYKFYGNPFTLWDEQVDYIDTLVSLKPPFS